MRKHALDTFKRDNLLVDFIYQHKGAKNVVSAKEIAKYIEERGYKQKGKTINIIIRRLVFERNDIGRFDHEFRPTFDAIFSSPEFWTMKLDLRTRFEMRKKERTSPYLRQRSRLRLRTSWSVTDFKISPFAFEEAFFSFKQNDETRNCFDRLRSAIGVSFKPIPSVDDLQCLLFYMVQHGVDNHTSEWDPTSFIGVEMRYSF
jgi:hypothetical protein